MRSFILQSLQIIVLFFFVDAGSITNQVVKTKGGHTCVLPTKVDKATGYWFVSNPQPGDVFEYCTLDHTGLFRNWPWCSYGNKFPDVENGVETFKWDYCTEYSWEYNGYKYTFKEAAVKSSFYKAEEFCKSQGGELPFFDHEKHEVTKVEFLRRHKLYTHYENIPIYDGDFKTTVMEALRPLQAYHSSSPKKGFWTKMEEFEGKITHVDTAKILGNYRARKCATVDPLGGANLVNCDEFYEYFADVLCRFPVEN